MGFLSNLFGVKKDQPASEPQLVNEPQRSDDLLSEEIVKDYEGRLSSIYEEILNGPDDLPYGIGKFAVFTPDRIANILSMGPADISDYFISMGTNSNQGTPPYLKAMARLRLSLEVYARKGVPIPDAVIDHLEKARSLLELSDAAEYYR